MGCVYQTEVTKPLWLCKACCVTIMSLPCHPGTRHCCQPLASSHNDHAFLIKAAIISWSYAAAMHFHLISGLCGRNCLSEHSQFFAIFIWSNDTLWWLSLVLKHRPATWLKPRFICSNLCDNIHKLFLWIEETRYKGVAGYQHERKKI